MSWHYTVGDEKFGPVPESELRDQIRCGRIGGETLIWTESMAEWLPLQEARPDLFEENPNPESTRPTTQTPTRTSGYSFGNPTFLSRLTKTLIVLATVSGLANSLATLALWNVVIYEDTAASTALDLLDYSVVPCFFGSFAAFLVWTHRVAANAWSFGGKWLTARPGWSVLWYIVPIANFWKPYQALRGIWQTSHQSGKVPAVLPTWWTLWILTGILDQISFQMWHLEGLEVYSARIDGLVSIIAIHLALTQWKIISGICHAQIQLASDRAS